MVRIHDVKCSHTSGSNHKMDFSWEGTVDKGQKVSRVM